MQVRISCLSTTIDGTMWICALVAIGGMWILFLKLGSMQISCCSVTVGGTVWIFAQIRGDCGYLSFPIIIGDSVGVCLLQQVACGYPFFYYNWQVYVDICSYYVAESEYFVAITTGVTVWIYCFSITMEGTVWIVDHIRCRMWIVLYNW